MHSKDSDGPGKGIRESQMSFIMSDACREKGFLLLNNPLGNSILIGRKNTSICRPTFPQAKLRMCRKDTSCAAADGASLGTGYAEGAHLYAPPWLPDPRYHQRDGASPETQLPEHTRYTGLSLNK